MSPLAPLLASSTAHDILEHHVLPHLGVQSLGRLERVCRASHALARAAGGGWHAACERTLATRTYVPAAVAALAERGDARACVRACLADASRAAPTLAELCAFEWCASLARAEHALRFRFDADGHLTRVVRAGDRSDASDRHAKRWAWQSSSRGTRLAVELQPGELHVCDVSRHANGGFVLMSRRAVFTSWEVTAAPRLPRRAGVNYSPPRAASGKRARPNEVDDADVDDADVDDADVDLVAEAEAATLQALARTAKRAC